MKKSRLRQIVQWNVPKFVKGWLCVDAKTYSEYYPIIFFPGKEKPFLANSNDEDAGIYIGMWRKKGEAWFGGEYLTLWSLKEWKRDFGNTRLPKKGKCELVEIELDILG